jgi:NADH-quinone oxidoreductase subunit J
MEPFFYFLATLAIASALMVTLSKNAVNAAMYMILCLIATAGLFGLLGAYFMAALQVLVYAGAIMVLFVFIIMLIDVEQEQKSARKPFHFVAGFIAAGLVAAGLVGLSLDPDLLRMAPSADALDVVDPMRFSGAAQPYGAMLFTKYLLPVQVMGFLLLVAMVGVIHLSKDLYRKAGVACPGGSKSNSAAPDSQS